MKIVWFTTELFSRFYGSYVLKPVVLVATLVTFAHVFAKWKFIFLIKLSEINCLML